MEVEVLEGSGTDGAPTRGDHQLSAQPVAGASPWYMQCDAAPCARLQAGRALP
jgi:hypothetical protein